MNMIKSQFLLDTFQHGFHSFLYEIWEILRLLVIFANQLRVALLQYMANIIHFM